MPANESEEIKNLDRRRFTGREKKAVRVSNHSSSPWREFCSRVTHPTAPSLNITESDTSGKGSFESWQWYLHLLPCILPRALHLF